jgi:hypothetical protein
MRKTTVRFFIGVVVGFAAAGMLIRIPRPITLSPSNPNTVKARRTETAFEQVASLASASCGASAPAAQLETKVRNEPNNDRTWTVVERATLNVDRSSSDRSATEQVHLVLRC